MALIQCVECGKNISDTTDECIHCGMKINLTPDELIREHKSNKSNELNPSDLIHEFKHNYNSRTDYESNTTGMGVSNIVASSFKFILEVIFVILFIAGFIVIHNIHKLTPEEYRQDWKTFILVVLIYYCMLVLLFGATFLMINTADAIKGINKSLRNIANRLN
jgi:hypothetical protein